jgi:hypothetical protein
MWPRGKSRAYFDGFIGTTEQLGEKTLLGVWLAG